MNLVGYFWTDVLISQCQIHNSFTQ